MWLDYTVAKPICLRCGAFHNVCECDICGHKCTYQSRFRGGFVCTQCGLARTVCRECLRIPFPNRSPHGIAMICWECAEHD